MKITVVNPLAPYTVVSIENVTSMAHMWDSSTMRIFERTDLEDPTSITEHDFSDSNLFMIEVI